VCWISVAVDSLKRNFSQLSELPASPLVCASAPCVAGLLPLEVNLVMATVPVCQSVDGLVMASPTR